jgi:hypothetical protein
MASTSSADAAKGKVFEFPNRYVLADMKNKFGGCFMD